MISSSFGDLASSYQVRRDTARIKSDLARYTNELSSGVKSDLVSVLRGDFRQIAFLEQGLEKAESYKSIIAEHRLSVDSQQAVLAKLHELGTLSSTLLSWPQSADQTQIRNAGAEALANFTTALSALNTQSGGRSLFSGTATNFPAVADADTILSALETSISVAGATTAAGVESVVSAWFANGGGYDSTGYVGGAASTTTLQLSDTRQSQPLLSAQDVSIREHLAALSMGALLGRGSVVLAGTEQEALVRRAGERLVASSDQLVATQADLGIQQAQIEQASVEVLAQASALEIARSDLIEADPYELAVSLQNSEAQLRTLYSITARLSQLSLAEYL